MLKSNSTSISLRLENLFASLTGSSDRLICLFEVNLSLSFVFEDLLCDLE